MNTNVILATIWALLRRIGTVAGSAVLTLVVQQWMGWVQGAFLANPKTAVVWPIVYLVLEVIQKYWREARKVKAA